VVSDLPAQASWLHASMIKSKIRYGRKSISISSSHYVVCCTIASGVGHLGNSPSHKRVVDELVIRGNAWFSSKGDLNGGKDLMWVSKYMALPAQAASSLTAHLCLTNSIEVWGILLCQVKYVDNK
jgi:hypothetical protein